MAMGKDFDALYVLSVGQKNNSLRKTAQAVAYSSIKNLLHPSVLDYTICKLLCQDERSLIYAAGI
jgi:hypothetical protein